MVCRKCNSNNVSFSKTVGWGPKMGRVFHYSLHCGSCKARYNVQRTKEIYDKVKDNFWKKTKTVLQRGL